MACAICNIPVWELLEALTELEDTTFNEVQVSILHHARELLRQQPEDPLAAPRRPLRPRRAFGYHKALIYRSKISGRVARIKAL